MDLYEIIQLPRDNNFVETQEFYIGYKSDT